MPAPITGNRSGAVLTLLAACAVLACGAASRSGTAAPTSEAARHLDVIDLGARAVVILAGTNDIAGNTGPISLEEIEENFESIAELARAHGVRAIFSSILPVHNYTPGADLNFDLRPPEKIVALNRRLENYCRANGLVYLDYFSAMVDQHGLMRRELADKGLHPNAAGYAVMTPLAAKAIEQALAASEAASRH